MPEDTKLLRKIKKEICSKDVPLENDDRMEANGEAAGDFALRYMTYILHKRAQKLQNRNKKENT